MFYFLFVFACVVGFCLLFLGWGVVSLVVVFRWVGLGCLLFTRFWRFGFAVRGLWGCKGFSSWGLGAF